MSFTLLFILRTFIATVLGFILGIQREVSGKPAGSRTIALVTLGSAVYTIMSAYGFSGITLDPSRVAAQIVVGVGFLGAGVIIFHQDKLVGVTTAATLWVAASIGMIVGLGYYLEAGFVCLLTLLLLMLARLNSNGHWFNH